MNKKALDILLKDYKFTFDPIPGFRTSSIENFELAKKEGLMFDNIHLTHNEAVDWLFEELKGITREQVVKNFIASLSTRNLAHRSTLSAFAVAITFEHHNFESSKIEFSCPICGDFGQFVNGTSTLKRDLNIINQTRLSFGGLGQTSISCPDTIAFTLRESKKLIDIEPTKADYKILKSTLDLLQSSEPNDSASSLEKKIGQQKTLKSSKKERIGLLETLSTIGVFDHEDKFGFFNNGFQAAGTRSLRPNGASKNDWGYPIIFWSGKHGLNRDAIIHWFGNYIES